MSEHNEQPDRRRRGLHMRIELSYADMVAIRDGIGYVLIDPFSLGANHRSTQPFQLVITGTFTPYDLGIAIGYACGAMLIPVRLHNALRHVVHSRDHESMSYALFTECDVVAFVARRYATEQA